MSRCRQLLLLAALVSTLVLPATLPAQSADPTTFLAFGDSITFGLRDNRGGYPARLEGLLADQGIAAVVENHGISGETTPEGLARIDSILDGGGDVLLLMEGTNDISRRVSVETIRFNLDEMARRAAERGMYTVHASVIPRSPEGGADSANNSTAAALARTLAETAAASAGRGFADPFAAFSAIPDLFGRFYADPYHPNPAGYDILADVFLPAAVEATRFGAVTILPPEGPVLTGQLVSFDLAITGVIRSTSWDFGDGGAALDDGADGSFAVPHLFTTAGDFEVVVTAVDGLGRAVEDRVSVPVVGPAVKLESRRSALQNLVSGATVSEEEGGDLLRGELWLHNAGTGPALVEIAPLPLGRPEDAPPPRVLTVPAGTSLGVPDVLSQLFAVPRGEATEAALLLTYRAPVAFGPPRVRAFARNLVEPADGSPALAGEYLEEEPEPAAGWSADEKVITGLTVEEGGLVVLRATNPSDEVGRVFLTLFDAAGQPVGEVGRLGLFPGTTRYQTLDRLFPEAARRAGPFTARLRSSGIPFLASATLVEAVSRDRVFLPAVEARRAEGGEGSLYLPRVSRGLEAYEVPSASGLVLHNPAAEETVVTVEFWPRGGNNRDPAGADLTLPPGATLAIDDVLAELFAEEDRMGALRLLWRNGEGIAPVAVSLARALIAPSSPEQPPAEPPQEPEEPEETEALPARPGTGVPALSGDDAIALTGLAFGAERTEVTQASYGVVNLRPARTEVELTLRDATGEVLATALQVLKAQQHLERNLVGIFSEQPLPAGGGWTVETEVLEGGPVLPYLLNANAAGDLYLLPARP